MMKPVLLLSLIAAAVVVVMPTSSTLVAATLRLDQLSTIQPLTSEEMEDFGTMKIATVFVFHDGGDIPDIGTEIAEKVDGLGRVVSVDVSKPRYASLLKRLGVTETDFPTARAYGPGEDKSSFLDSDDADELAKYIEEAVPDSIVAEIEGADDFQAPFFDGLREKKLTLFIFTDKPGVPRMVKKLAVWLGHSFRFVIHHNPEEQLKQAIGLTKIPSAMTLVPGGEENGAQLAFHPAFYDRKQFGALKFINLVRFCMTLQSQLAQSGVLEKMFPQDGDEDTGSPFASSSSDAASSAADATPVEITPDSGDYCGEGQLGLCLFLLLDGSPSNEEKDAQLAVLENARSTKSNRGRVLHLLWVDSVCHPSFADHFNVPQDLRPSLIAYSPSKKIYAQLFGGYEEASVSAFITGVLTGKERMTPIDSLPVLNSGDNCEEMHAMMAAPIEEEFDLSDLDDVELDDDEDGDTAPQAGTSRRDASSANTATETDISDEDAAAKEAARNIAMKELERLNKRNKKKKSKKSKKKKTRRRKKKRSAEEL